MQGHAAALAHGLAAPLLWQAVFIEGVAGFVDHCHQALHEIGFIVTGGDSHITVRATTEGVVGDVEAAPIEGKAEHCHEFVPELLLSFYRERTLRHKRLGACGLFLHDLLDESGQETPQVVKNPVHLHLPAPRIILVEHGLIGCDPHDVGLDVGLFTFEPEQRVQFWRETGEIVFGPRRPPAHCRL